MVWGAFCNEEVVEMEFITSKMNSQAYQQVLDKRLLPFYHQSSQQSLQFMQDNATVHTSRATLAWLKDELVDAMDWPALSPDLNPIENVWGMLARNIYANGKQYNTIEELQQAIYREWTRMNPNFQKTLVTSMPCRIFECIQRNGGVTHYALF